MADAWVVVKVGGSLYDWPLLRKRLNAWLDELNAPKILLIPGGGMTANAVRIFDRAHHLGDETAHALALRAMSFNAHFLQTMLPSARLVSEIPVGEAVADAIQILDAYSLFLADDNRPDHLPHDWRVTSDSLALRAAVLARARELILLKSLDWEGRDWRHAVSEQVVDVYFPEAFRQAPTLRIRIVNLRSWRGETAHE